jgi:photosystem II stability/assembly factor-like uncharacterized protein
MRLSLRISLLSLCLAVTTLLLAQQATPAAERSAGYEQYEQLAEKNILHDLEFSNIGPTVQSGRVVDLAVNPDDPTEFYVAYASGGLWHTANNGISFTPLFQDEAVMTIGALAVDWPTNTIYLGTGEVNSSRSSYAGNGMYKSTDGGQTWTHQGLEETHHIGRVLIHPDDVNTAWVAALGHLYGSNPERGVYKTTDGGQTWTQTLFVNDNTGAVELVLDPADPDVLYAATWERTRRAWDFQESGPGSGIYRSTDGGDSFSLITPEGSGFPMGEGAGRIGLALAHRNGEPVLYASIDNYFRREKEEPEADVLTKDMLRSMPTEDLLRLETYLLEDFLRSNGFPREVNAKSVRQKLEAGTLTPLQLVEYTEDANTLLFETPVKGFEVYRYDFDSGDWTRTHDDYIDGVYSSYGYYFGILAVNPSNPDQLYALGVPIIRSDDGGKTWRNINGDNVHSDHHAIWINPRQPGHIINGNDGGVNISYDNGENWFLANTPPVGQFYYIAVDNKDRYNVYGGLQDNGVLMGPHDYEASTRWHSTGRYPYEAIMGGDGMQVAVDPRDNETVYTGFQFGNYFRLNTRTGRRSFITPRHELGERPYRWNWQSPIHVSTHNPDIVYFGANFLFRSLNQGDDWDKISEDLTHGGKKGDVPYGTLTAIHESPLRYGLLYTGSDDGRVHVSRDGGYSWTEIVDGLPQDMWVSRVQASAHEPGRVYLSLNGYRWDDFRALVYRSEDYGQTWQPIFTDLPAEPVNVIKEDPENPDLLYVGTDHGLYFSLDGGETSFTVANGQFPRVAVHDVVVHPKEKDLIVGTHGRSLYRTSVAELQQLTAARRAEPLYAFQPDAIRAGRGWGRAGIWVDADAEGPKVHFPVWSSAPGAATITIAAEDGPTLRTLKADLQAGLNYVPYDLTIDKTKSAAYAEALNKKRKDDEKPIKVTAADDGKTYVRPGKLAVTIQRGKAETKTSLEVK